MCCLLIIDVLKSKLLFDSVSIDSESFLDHVQSIIKRRAGLRCVAKAKKLKSYYYEMTLKSILYLPFSQKLFFFGYNKRGKLLPLTPSVQAVFVNCGTKFLAIPK